MKHATGYWGIQILAETEDDERLLRDLYDRLERNPTRHRHNYEDGSIKIMTPDDADGTWGFTRAEVEGARLVIEFFR